MSVLLKCVHRKILGYVILILFTGYFGGLTLFPHNHIVESITVVHSHPFKSHSGNLPFNHNHPVKGFVLIQFISVFISTILVVYQGFRVFREVLNDSPVIPEKNIYFGQFHFFTKRPRAPAL
jgi:hypothetical protein